MIVELPHIAECPNCGGTGQEYSLQQATLIKCVVCNGKRYMPGVSCKGCGRPAIKFWPPHQRPIVLYCGLESCLAMLVVIHKSRVSPAIVSAVQQIMGPAKRIDAMEELRQDMLRNELGDGFHGDSRDPGWQSM